VVDLLSLKVKSLREILFDGKKIRLLALHGYEDRLQLDMSTVYDGTGGWREVLLATSEEEGEEMLTGHIKAELGKHKNGYNRTLGRYIEAAAERCIPIPPGFREEYAKDEKARILKDIKYNEGCISTARKHLERDLQTLRDLEDLDRKMDLCASWNDGEECEK
jgi:hypothetical protein